MSLEKITRRTLPHWYVPGAAHFITYRLFGSIPVTVLDQLRTRKLELLNRSPKADQTVRQHRELVHKQLFALYDSWLDRGGDARWLADPRIAAVVRSNLYHHNGSKYHLLAYCIMSNHVHVLLQPVNAGVQASRLHYDVVGEVEDGKSPLAGIMHSLKSYTAHEANRILNRAGTFWQAESYDHWIRDEEELERVVAYIAGNPLKAGLVLRPEEWFFCSAHDRLLRDGELSAWLA